MPKPPRRGFSSLGRREMLGLTGSAAVTSAALAGCLGSRGSDTGDESSFRSALEEIDFGADYERRRRASFDDWSFEQRRQTPENDRRSTDSWLESEAVQSAPWTPPPGWEDTAASEVETIEILNYGDVEFDPATAAVDALFEAKTGITMKRIQVPMEQAIPRAAAFLSQEQSSPHMLQATTSSSMTQYAGNGWIEPVDAVMPDEGMWDMYLPICRDTYNWNGSLWGGPGTLEGVPVNVRVDLLEEQGLDAELEAIREGTWTWDELESVMAAFEGTDVYGFGFRGASPVDTERDWRQLWYQTGGQYVSDDGTVSIDEGGLIALRKLVEWKENGWLPPDSVNWGEGEFSDGFVSGQLALAPIATDIVGDALAAFEPGEEYIIARPPKATEGPDPRHATYAGGPVSAINTFASTGHRLAAALYQDCRFSEAASWFEYVEEGNMAPARAVYDQAAEHDVVFMSEVREQVMEDAKNEVFAQQRTITREVSTEIQEAYAGDKSPEAAIEDAQAFIDSVLRQD